MTTTRSGKTYDNVGNRYKIFSKEEQELWPEGHRGCTKCKLVQTNVSFGAHPNGVGGLDSVCKVCRRKKASADYAKRPYERIIFDRAKSRATKKGIPFDITLDDIVIPETCPILNIPLIRAEGLMTDNSPSIDRLNPSLGYVQRNIAIISNRANRIKSNATAGELLSVAHWMESRSMP